MMTFDEFLKRIDDKISASDIVLGQRGPVATSFRREVSKVISTRHVIELPEMAGMIAHFEVRLADPKFGNSQRLYETFIRFVHQTALESGISEANLERLVETDLLERPQVDAAQRTRRLLARMSDGPDIERNERRQKFVESQLKVGASRGNWEDINCTIQRRLFEEEGITFQSLGNESEDPEELPVERQAPSSPSPNRPKGLDRVALRNAVLMKPIHHPGAQAGYNMFASVHAADTTPPRQKNVLDPSNPEDAAALEAVRMHSGKTNGKSHMGERPSRPADPSPAPRPNGNANGADHGTRATPFSAIPRGETEIDLRPVAPSERKPSAKPSRPLRHETGHRPDDEAFRQRVAAALEVKSPSQVSALSRDACGHPSFLKRYLGSSTPMKLRPESRHALSDALDLGKAEIGVPEPAKAASGTLVPSAETITVAVALPLKDSAPETASTTNEHAPSSEAGPSWAARHRDALLAEQLYTTAWHSLRDHPQAREIENCTGFLLEGTAAPFLHLREASFDRAMVFAGMSLAHKRLLVLPDSNVDASDDQQSVLHALQTMVEQYGKYHGFSQSQAAGR